MPQWPHEYVIRDKWDGALPWENVVQFMREHGDVGYFGKGRAKRHYFRFGGMRYWTLGWGLSVTNCLNRDVDVPVSYLVMVGDDHRLDQQA